MGRRRRAPAPRPRPHALAGRPHRARRPPGLDPGGAEVLDDLPALAARCDALVDDIDDVLVMGMGGSSLFPEVLARTLEPAPGRPRLHVLDTTDPAAIARIADSCPPERTLHLASSKSGSTIETRSHLEWAWARAAGGGRFAVVTDPGLRARLRSPGERGFADVFENRADIGGRYSALSLFGIVPALLMGADAAALLRGGLDALADERARRRPGAQPGAGAGRRDGRRGAGRAGQGHLRPAARGRHARAVDRAARRRVARQGRHRRHPDRRGAGRRPRRVRRRPALPQRTTPLDELAAAGHPVVPLSASARRRPRSGTPW